MVSLLSVRGRVVLFPPLSVTSAPEVVSVVVAVGVSFRFIQTAPSPSEPLIICLLPAGPSGIFCAMGATC